MQLLIRDSPLPLLIEIHTCNVGFHPPRLSQGQDRDRFGLEPFEGPIVGGQQWRTGPGPVVTRLRRRPKPYHAQPAARPWLQPWHVKSPSARQVAIGQFVIPDVSG